MKPRLGALRKNLQRCSCSQQGQGLISVEKVGRNNFYRITEKGKKRCGIIAAKKEKEFNDWLDSIFRDDKAKRFKVSQQKSTRFALAKRIAEIMSSLKLCDTLLSGSSDPNTVNYALALRTYWQIEESKLIPYITEELARVIDELSGQFARSVEKMLR